MYPFSYFKEKDRAVMLQLLERHPFAFLTGSFRDGTQAATQVPLLFEERDGKLVLTGHIMRNTDHHRAFLENPRVLAVFTGPNTYVSATWYTNPRIGSTWNYMSVHVHGRIRFMTDAELEVFMRAFTLTFEQGDTASPTILDNLPREFVARMMPVIAGFEIEAEQVDTVFKLSQNRDEASYRNIIAKLEERGGDAFRIAQEMKQRRQDLFPPGATWDPSRFDS